MSADPDAPLPVRLILIDKHTGKELTDPTFQDLALPVIIEAINRRGLLISCNTIEPSFEIRLPVVIKHAELVEDDLGRMSITGLGRIQ